MATFTCAVRYDVQAACLSPLRTGSTEGDNNLILTDSNHRPMLQAASIAGVLRAYVASQDEAEAARIFGGDEASLLTVSDGLFQADEKDISFRRPRLKIDRATGAGEYGKLFSLKSVLPGSSFDFTLLLQTKGRDELAELAVEDSLAALNSGELTLGGQRSNGFGLVSLTVKKRVYDLKTEQGRTDWLEDALPTELLPLESRRNRHIVMTLEGYSEHFLVKEGTPRLEEGKMIVKAMQRNDSFDLPGSSLKGCLRSRAEWIARFKGCEEVVSRLFGRGDDKDREDNGIPGQLRVRDCVLEKTEAQCRNITRTRLDRFTGGVLQKALFSEQVVSGTVRIQVELFTRDAACCGLLFYALRDLAMGLYSFGSEGSIGRGRLLPEKSCLRVTDGSECCSFTFGSRFACEGNSAAVQSWLEALENGTEEVGT